MRINNYKMFLESLSDNRIGELTFANLYLDSFYTSLEDSDIEHKMGHYVVSADAQLRNVPVLISTSNGVNNIDYKYVYKISCTSKHVEINKDYITSEVENLKHDLDGYDVLVIFAETDANVFYLYIVSQEIIPCSKWNKELQEEISKLLASKNMIDGFIFQDEFPTFIFGIQTGYSDDYKKKFDDIIETISQKWSIRSRNNGNSVMIDLNLLIQDE